jgi:lysophospholipase L1-like esterase
VTADTYNGAAWSRPYWAEFHRSKDDMRWTPYVYWRRRPRVSPYINVDEKGIRATPTSAANGLKIFVFGGSTVWGSGARDEFTIPSILARELAQRGTPATVTNFGESGWVSTQELVALQLELQNGNRPDLVIFYDGINDTYTAFQQGVAGIPQNEFNRIREFNFMEKSVKERARLIGRDAATRLATRRLFNLLTSDPPEELGIKLDEAAPGFALDDAALGVLAGRIVDIYAKNVELVKALGEHYDFKSLFYWQPAVGDKPHLTEYEKLCGRDMVPTDRFFRRTNQAFRERQLDRPGPFRVRDLTGVFAETAAPVFVDRFHLGETGNEMIVKQMLPDVLAEIAGGDAFRAGAHAHATR